jgi:DNA recombination protein RmuC
MDLSSSAILIIAFIVIIALIIIFYFILNSKTSLLSQQVSTLDQQKTMLQTEFLQERSLLNEVKLEKERLLQDNTRLESDFKNLRLKYEEYVQDTDKLQERFENLANKILDDKTKKFDETHKKGMKEILDPLKEKIKSFEEKVEKTNKESIERSSALRQQIYSLKEINDRMSKETINLTKALKGDSKTQGNWGELILESILEKSGLEKDREYFVQASVASDNGKIYRPDVIINLPDDKKLIIDSKVSLKAYEVLVNNDNEEEQKIALKAHSLSVKTHIDGLAAKNYHDLYAIASPDFVLMFVPIDTAFSAALSHNSDLYSYAFEKNIVIVTPATLLATLKTVDTMWKNNKQQRYAFEIASEAGKMYDKFSSLVDDLIGLGKRIDQTKITYEESMKKLHFGKGDLITRAEKIKKLGAKANKDLPKNLIERSEETN